MKRYSLSARSLPMDDGWDVAVIGGGPAGCAAAIAAAREGARTLLVEAESMLGGMGTAGLVPWFCGYGDGKRMVARGIAEIIRLRLAQEMPHIRRFKQLHPDQELAPAIDPEALKRIYDDLVLTSGVEVLFHTQVCGVEMADSNHIEALLLSSKAGLQAIQAKIYIDATGDGDVAAWAGAEFEQGDAKGDLQPATLCFLISNIDEEALANGPRIHINDPESPTWKAARSDKYPLIDEPRWCNIKIAAGTLGFNVGHVYDVDNTIPRSTTKALFKGRQIARQYHEAFKEFHPAFRNSVLVTTAPLMGIRETRRIIGEYYLTGDDYRQRRSFDDEICRSAYGIDIHGSRESAKKAVDMTIEEIQARNARIVQPLKPGESFGVPYRCLLPKGLHNCLVTGRCISSDREANGSIRIMACCLNTGEAAGCAAGLSCKAGTSIREVESKTLRTRLRDRGAYLPD